MFFLPINVLYLKEVREDSAYVCVWVPHDDMIFTTCSYMDEK